jgi:hydrogenase-1 operon protein HyaF
MKEFPIPVRSIGPGSQPEEDEALAYMPMPQGMETFRPPVLPEPEQLAAHVAAGAALADLLRQLGACTRGQPYRDVDLRTLPPADLGLVNEMLGEGEVSALVQLDAGPASPARVLRVQEAVFAGVWRVIETVDGQTVDDRIEVGAIPAALRRAALADAATPVQRWQGGLPPNVQNAPALLAEIDDQRATWQPDGPPHVINLTLLPMSVEDIGFLDHQLGTGGVLILSRGYGNCRITNCRVPNCWRVVYYNSQDVVILNTVEMSGLPEVAQAAPEDLADSFERLGEVLEWLEVA